MLEDEIIEPPVLPEDDGLPLSAEERKAMQSTGELDAGLSTEELRQVQLHFKFYVHKHRKTFERYLARSEAYLPYVKKVLRERGVPEEVAYLAIVESGFNPNAVSPAGAVGMWQFMPFTGKKYGLAQDSWVDERRDPFQATGAAADYLNKLHGDFGDWLFAIAAYNAGEGKIGKAIECTGANDFFELCRLNDTIPEEKTRLKNETQQYVPRFLAVCKIMRNLEILGFKEPNPNFGLDLAPVEVPPGTSLGGLAAKAGMSWNEFSDLNPGFRRKISPPSASSRAYLPKGASENAVAWLKTPESKIYAGWTEYKVRKGDSLGAIAKRYGIPASAIRTANRLKNDRLSVGQALLVPSSSKDAAELQGKIEARTVVKSKPEGRVPGQKTPERQSARLNPVKDKYTVCKGDTLSSIARQYGLTPSDVRTANGFAVGFSDLKVGQKLLIPDAGKKGAAPEAAAKPAAKPAGPAERGLAPEQSAAGGSGRVITVQPGDTLYSLASKNKVSVESLRKVNGLGGNDIKTGQRLRLP